MIQVAALLPIAPLLLLPFILIFFIAVFPVWLVAMIVLGALRALARKAAPNAGPTRVLERAFVWVKTFGGFIHLGEGQPE